MSSTCSRVDIPTPSLSYYVYSAYLRLTLDLRAQRGGAFAAAELRLGFRFRTWIYSVKSKILKLCQIALFFAC